MAREEAAPQIVPNGDRALLVEFGRAVNPALNARARALAEYLLANPLPCVTDVVPTYVSVTVHFDAIAAAAHFRTGNPLEALRPLLEKAVARAPTAPRRRPRTVEIPVAYGGEFGEDLAEVAKHCGLTAEEVIRLHSAPLYEVAMLGFVPGFGYLSGLDRRLATPRRETPRKRTPAGSVGIGGEHTAVYPIDTPGGWRIIGRTPRRLFRLEEEGAPSVMEAGDRVKFVPVTAAEFERLKASQA